MYWLSRISEHGSSYAGGVLGPLLVITVGLGLLFVPVTLVVNLDAVKKHVGDVLGKLAAANRTEAVTRARQLGLIP